MASFQAPASATTAVDKMDEVENKAPENAAADEKVGTATTSGADGSPTEMTRLALVVEAAMNLLRCIVHRET